MAGKVIVLGGGVAGMSAAHELMERGFQVEVYERRSTPGGKARSMRVPGTGTPRDGVDLRLARKGLANRKDLPGEHGFRFFPRFYRHVVDTMARIPAGPGRAVLDNLVETTRIQFARYDLHPILLPAKFPTTLSDLALILTDFATIFDPDVGIPHDEMAFFAARTWQILTSCRERRLAEYEKIGWWEFIEADRRSQAYQNIFGHGFTRSLVAAQAERASTKTVGDMFVQLFFNVASPGISADRVLNGPTSDVWLEPWYDYLTAYGVQFHFNATVQGLNCDGRRIQSVTIQQGRRILQVRGDQYVAALPVEVMARLVSPMMLAADPALADVRVLADNVAGMNGLQIYLTEDLPIVHGHSVYVDSPWALTSISQRQFWKEIDLSEYGDGRVRGVLSVDISEWDEPGINGKTARECTEQEIKEEVWRQLKRSLNVDGHLVVRDEILHSWFLASSLVLRPRFPADERMVNEEPLLVNYVDTWRLRPDAATRIPNLVLASDYVRTHTDLACMEAANEAARRAVNAIIDVSAAEVPHCTLWDLNDPAFLEPWRAYDRARWKEGLPWDAAAVTTALSAIDILKHTAQSVKSSLGALVSPADRAGLGLGAPPGAGSPEESGEALWNDFRTLLDRAAEFVVRSGMAARSAASLRRVATGRYPDPTAPPAPATTAGRDRDPAAARATEAATAHSVNPVAPAAGGVSRSSAARRGRVRFVPPPR